MTEYKKTRWMNIVGAVGMAGITLLGTGLFFNKVGEQLDDIFMAAIVLMCVVFTALPVFSALALSPTFSRRGRSLVIGANWFFVAWWVIGILTALYTHIGIAQSAAGVLMLVLPQAINIRALRQLNQ